MAGKSMTQSQIIAKLAEGAELSKKQVKCLIDSVADLAYKEAKNGFTLPGLGKLVLVDRKARIGRNPATGEPIKIPAKKVVKFRVAKAAKEAIAGRKKALVSGPFLFLHRDPSSTKHPRIIIILFDFINDFIIFLPFGCPVLARFLSPFKIRYYEFVIMETRLNRNTISNCFSISPPDRSDRCRRYTTSLSTASSDISIKNQPFIR
jgi:DNA-binding protein HU-beta